MWPEGAKPLTYWGPILDSKGTGNSEKEKNKLVWTWGPNRVLGDSLGFNNEKTYEPPEQFPKNKN